MNETQAARRAVRDLWAVVGASVPGDAHEEAGEPGQDACHGEVLPDGTMIIAVADGSGAARFGSEGAGLAVDVAVAHVRELLLGAEALPSPAGILTGAFDAAREALARQARVLLDDPARIGEWATTLTLAVSRPHAFWVAQRGNGAVIARRDGAFVVAAYPQAASDERFLLTDPNGHLLIDVELHDPVDAFAVITDALLPLALERPSDPREPFFDPLYAFAAAGSHPIAARQHLRDFLRSPRVSAFTSDDRTIVIALRHPEAAAALPADGDVALG
ncbi:MAG: protein phosphatase 2C domain-containing protein [Chloroflexota bacterium]